MRASPLTLINRSLVAVLLVTLLPLAALPAHADDDDDLKGWQRRMLRALERSEQKSEGRDRGGDRQSLVAPGRRDEGASAAAARAQSRYGGRPLAVTRGEGGYRVRLLLDNGRVTTVQIDD